MPKYKCAILRPREGYPVPTAAELESQLDCKVLFGLGKPNLSELPAQTLINVNERFGWAESVFRGDFDKVRHQLVVFDNEVNAVLFTLRFGEVIVCRFELDEAIGEEVYRLSDGLRDLMDTRFVIVDQVEDLEMFKERRFGDSAFQEYLANARVDLQRYIDELQRVIDLMGRESKALFFSEW